MGPNRNRRPGVDRLHSNSLSTNNRHWSLFRIRTYGWSDFLSFSGFGNKVRWRLYTLYLRRHCFLLLGDIAGFLSQPAFWFITTKPIIMKNIKSVFVLLALLCASVLTRGQRSAHNQ